MLYTLRCAQSEQMALKDDHILVVIKRKVFNQRCAFCIDLWAKERENDTIIAERTILGITIRIAKMIRAYTIPIEHKVDCFERCPDAW